MLPMTQYYTGAVLSELTHEIVVDRALQQRLAVATASACMTAAPGHVAHTCRTGMSACKE